MQKERGITLIALIITIIVMLILVGVTVTVALNGGLFITTKKASMKTEIELIKEQAMIKTTEKIAESEDKSNNENLTVEQLNIPTELKDKYRDKIIINNIGELEYDPAIVKGEEREIFDESGVICIADYFNFREGYNYDAKGPDTGERGIRSINSKGKEAINKGKTVFQIPSETREGMIVTKIGPYAFDSINIKEFILPDTILSIDERAFKSGSGEVRIPKSVIATSFEIFLWFKGNVYLPFTREEGVPAGWGSFAGGTIIYADEVEQ